MKFFVSKKNIEKMRRDLLDEASRTHQEQINRIKEEHNEKLNSLVVQTSKNSNNVSNQENILEGLSPLFDKLKEMTNQSDTIKELTRHNIKLQDELTELKKKYDLLKENREITQVNDIVKKPLSKTESNIFEIILKNDFINYSQLLVEIKKSDKSTTKNKLISIVNRIKNKGYPWIFIKKPSQVDEEEKFFTTK